MKLCGVIKKEADEAFFTKKFQGNCSKCGKQGHNGANCWSKKGSGTDKRLCYKCKKAGHLKKDCPELKKKTEETAGMFAGMVECYEGR